MSFEITVPTGTPLTGAMSATILDSQGVAPGNIIHVDDDWSVEFKWSLKGPLAGCISGDWCLRVHLESIGSGPELNLFENNDVIVPLDPCGDGHYSRSFDVKAGDVPAEAHSSIYKVVATITYRTPCKKPGPMAGFADLGLLQFYKGEH